MITHEGEEAFMQMLFQGDNTIVAAGANFYLGVCNQTPIKTDTLSDISSEPSSAGGYARQALVRNSTDFPTLGQVDAETRILSILATFAASGADFSAPFTRLFLTDAASGSVGTLFCYSGAYSAAIQLLDGQSKDVQFEFYP